MPAESVYGTLSPGLTFHSSHIASPAALLWHPFLCIPSTEVPAIEFTFDAAITEAVGVALVPLVTGLRTPGLCFPLPVQSPTTGTSPAWPQPTPVRLPSLLRRYQ
ncbi:MAG: hypothetical protein ACREBI_04330 [Nitrosotalea sp.]